MYRRKETGAYTAPESLLQRTVLMKHQYLSCEERGTRAYHRKR
jgi:hypothetical protein